MQSWKQCSRTLPQRNTVPKDRAEVSYYQQNNTTYLSTVTVISWYPFQSMTASKELVYCSLSLSFDDKGLNPADDHSY